MKTKIDWINVARLVAGIISLVFFAGAIVYLIGVAPDMQGIFTELFTYFHINTLLFCLVNLLYPLVMLAVALFVMIHSFFKRSRLLSVTAILYAVSCLIFSVYGFIQLQTGSFELIFWLLFGVYLAITLLYLPIIFDSFKKKSYTLSKVLSIVAFVLHTLFVTVNSIEIQYAVANYTRDWLIFFYLITPLVPFALSLLVICPKTFESDVQNVETPEQ